MNVEARRSPVLLAALGIPACGAAVLHFMGRRLWCACGSWIPWSWDVWSSHCSQHLIDWYSFTHVQHGALYYALLWLLFGSRWPALRMLGALLVEVSWEIGENTDAVIQAYRESTISLDYYGDSILNSLGDVAACALGYAASSRLPVRAVLVGAVLVELALVLLIRDSLLLNVLMLLHPIPAIKAWQQGS